MRSREKRIAAIENALGVGKSLRPPVVFFYTFTPTDDLVAGVSFGETSWERLPGESTKALMERVAPAIQDLMVSGRLGLAVLNRKE